MAKELPYYQFEPAEHLAGDIQMCSLAAQGLFENIKSVYWIKGCELTLKQVEGRFKEPELIKELLGNDILKMNKDSICIEFLDEQYKDIIFMKELFSKAGKKGYLAKKKKATLKPPLSEVEAPLKHLDKIKEDKIKEKNIKESYGEFITMSKDEFNNLVKRFGEQRTRAAIDKLDNYKGSSGKKYASDYRTILTWVIDEVPLIKKHNIV